jgi:hypothetical protein
LKQAHTLAIGLFIVAIVLIAPLASQGLDDFDSVSFALAMTRYDLSLQQPHAPGFPLYIGIANALNFFMSNAQQALVWVSLLGGALGVVALFYIGETWGGTGVGWWSAVLLLLTPAWWLTSGMALSDVVGMALPLMVMASGITLMNAPTLSQRNALWAWVSVFGLMGLALGIRPHNALPLGILALWMLVAYHRITLWQRWLWASLAGLMGVAVWLLPMLSALGGWQAYWQAVSGHSQHVLGVDSLIGQAITSDLLALRWNAFANGWIALFGNHALLALCVVVLASIATLAHLVWHRRHISMWLLLVWILAVTLKLFLLESLERPRLFLPILPPLYVWIVWGWSRLIQHFTPKFFAPKIVFNGLFGALAIALFAVSLPLAMTLHTQRSAPEQATAYVRQNYPPLETALVTFGSYRAVQYALSDYHLFYMIYYEPQMWSRDITSLAPRYLVLFDRDEIWSEAYTAITSALNYVPIDDQTFRRDPRVFPQHSTVRVQILTPLSQVLPAQLALPSDGVLRVGDERDGKFFADGWYRAETIGEVAGRWTDQEAVFRVALPPKDYVMQFTATSFGAQQSVEVVVNGQSVGNIALNGVWQPYEINIPSSLIMANSITTIVLRHARTDIPSGSNRSLAVAYSSISLR